MPQKILWTITFNLMKSCMEFDYLLNSEVCSVYYGLSSKYTIVLQGTFPENSSSLSPLKLERIPSGWIYMWLFIIRQKSLLPQLSKHFLKTSYIYSDTAEDVMSVISGGNFFSASLPSIYSDYYYMGKLNFPSGNLINKKNREKVPKLKSKKHSCKAFVFKRKITLGQKAQAFHYLSVKHRTQRPRKRALRF